MRRSGNEIGCEFGFLAKPTYVTYVFHIEQCRQWVSNGAVLQNSLRFSLLLLLLFFGVLFLNVSSGKECRAVALRIAGALTEVLCSIVMS